MGERILLIENDPALLEVLEDILAGERLPGNSKKRRNGYPTDL